MKGVDITVQGLPDIETTSSSGLLYKVKTNEFRLNDGQKPIVIVSGPSGSGKDTIIDNLPKNKFQRVRTCTTRAKREEEKENDPYIRFTKEQFIEGMARGDFIEHEIYDNHYYGTRFQEISLATKRTKTPLLRIDPSGAKNYVTGEIALPGFMPLYFFVITPTLEEIRKRLMDREINRPGYSSKRDTIQIVEQRLDLVKRDLKLSSYAHYIVINSDNRFSDAAVQLAYEVSKLTKSI